MIELLQFSKKYGQRPVLDIEERSIEKGLYLLKGVNGSGKSTLLQSIAARLPFGGQIKIDGISIKQNPRLSREKVSYAAAEPLFPECLTGAHLLSFFEKTKGNACWELKDLMKGFSVNEFLDKATGSYSSGMLKKLSLLLAFTGRPAWILLDEPYNGLDVKSADELSGFIEVVYEKYKIGFIIASHQSNSDQHLRPDMLQTLLLENGKLQTI